MTQIYRLIRTERANDALSGEGSRLYGGRWNPPGYSVVYASESRALAVLETFVHLALEARSMRFLLYTIELPKRTRLQRYGARPSLGGAGNPVSSQGAGRAWLDEGATLALVVPSVIVPQECNYLMNARHPHFGRLRVANPEPFSFDERLWQSYSAGE